MARNNDGINRTFSGWLAAIGDEPAAALLKVPIRTIRSWRLRERTPSADMARHIVATLGGAVTMDMIYRGGGKP